MNHNNESQSVYFRRDAGYPVLLLEISKEKPGQASDRFTTS